MNAARTARKQTAKKSTGSRSHRRVHLMNAPSSEDGHGFIGTPRAISSAGERSLHTREVAGSNPASPTTTRANGEREMKKRLLGIRSEIEQKQRELAQLYAERKTLMTTISAERLLKEYLDGGGTYSELGDRYGLPKAYVGRVINELFKQTNPELYYPSRARKRVGKTPTSHPTFERNNRMFEEWRAGASQAKLAIDYGLSRGRVWQIITIRLRQERHRSCR